MKEPAPASAPAPVAKLSLWKRLQALEGSPHAIAGGLAVGMFFGVSPLWGVKTILTLGTAAALRLNPIAAFISLSIHDLFAPFLPITFRLQYDIGFWLMSHPHHLPPKLEMTTFHPQDLLHWTTYFHAGLPLLIGSMTAAIPLTILTYFVSRKYLEYRKSRLTGKS